MYVPSILSEVCDQCANYNIDFHIKESTDRLTYSYQYVIGHSLICYIVHVKIFNYCSVSLSCHGVCYYSIVSLE